MRFHIVLRSLVFSASIIALPNSEIAAKEIGESNAQNEDIVVVGPEKQMAEFEKLITNQFNVTGGGRHNGQYARFAVPVCPSVSGLSDRQSRAIEKRIRQVASMADVPVAKEKCKPNLFLAVVKDGSSEIKTLRRKKSRLFGQMTHRERDKIEQSGGPAYSWKATATLSSDSAQSAKSGSYTLVAGEGSIGAITAGGQRSHVKSKIARSTMEGIAYSYLLVDIEALNGISAAQLADYAAMVSLIDIEVGMDTEVPTGSILSLFSEIEDISLRPQSLSGGDLLLLRALYKAPANVKAPLQRSAMIYSMSEGLNNPERVIR